MTFRVSSLDLRCEAVFARRDLLFALSQVFGAGTTPSLSISCCVCSSKSYVSARACRSFPVVAVLPAA